MENVRDGRTLFDGLVIGVERGVGRLQELFEVQGPEIHDVDHSDGEGLRLGQEAAEETSRYRDVVFGRCFLEILERIEGFRTFLDLVKDDESLAGKNALSGNHRKEINDPVRIFARFEDGLEILILIEVEIDEILVAVLSKFLQQPCFSDLPGPSEEKGLSCRTIFPFL